MMGDKVCARTRAALFGIVLLSGCNGLTDVERFRACPECVDGGSDASIAPTDTARDAIDVDDVTIPTDVHVEVIDPDDATVCEDGAICDDHDACTSNVCGVAGCTFPLVLDMDDDKHVAKSLGLSCGDDCDDGDSSVFPGQTAWFNAPKDVAGFDYDCDGRLERRWTELGTCSTSACTLKEGWLDHVPDCGFIADWVRSCTSGSSCAAETVERRTQECH